MGPRSGTVAPEIKIACGIGENAWRDSAVLALWCYDWPDHGPHRERAHLGGDQHRHPSPQRRRLSDLVSQFHHGGQAYDSAEQSNDDVDRLSWHRSSGSLRVSSGYLCFSAYQTIGYLPCSFASWMDFDRRMWWRVFVFCEIKGSPFVGGEPSDHHCVVDLAFRLPQP